MIRLKSTEWRDCGIQVYGEKYTIRAEAAGIGPVTLVFSRGRGKITFLGVERLENNPRSEFAGDLPPMIKSLGSGAVAKTAWLKLYRESEQRRSYYA
jgi:hypothetical protein